MKIRFHNMMKRIKKPAGFCKDKRMCQVIERLKLCLFILILYLFLSLLHIGCPIRFITGISCPGCGMTRAVLAACRFHFTAAFYYHPLFILAPVMLLLFLFEAYLNPGLYKAAWIIIIFLFLFVYIIRLLIFQNNVVLIDIKNGIVVKLLYKILVGGFKC